VRRAFSGIRDRIRLCVRPSRLQMAKVSPSGYVIAKPYLKLSGPPTYVKPSHAIAPKPTVVYGNSRTWESVQLWLSTRPSGKVMVLRGPSGSGKTHTTTRMATRTGFAVTEFNASFGQSPSTLATLLREASLVRRLHGKNRLILVDEIDSMTSDMQLVVLEHVRQMDMRFAPLVCTCNDFASATIRSIGGLAALSLELRAISNADLLKYAKCYYQKIPERTRHLAISSSNGDIRQLDIRLRVSDAATPDLYCNLFELGRALVTRRKPSQWLAGASVGTDSRMILYLAHENYTSSVPSLCAMADAAELYSNAECMHSYGVIGALDDIVSTLGASGPTLSECVWTMRHDTKIRWPELLRAKPK